VTTAFVSRPPPCTRGNEARDISVGSSIVETAGSVREEPKAEHHLRVEKARGSLWSYSTEVLGPRVGFESRPEGVNRRNLKIINLSTHYKPGLALELKSSPKERAKNKSKANEMNDMVICFTEVRFLQTYSPLRWSQRPGLFQPFPSLKRSLRLSELFSLIKSGHLDPYKDHRNLVSLALITSCLRTRKRKKKSDLRTRAQRTRVKLSL
jgi:hypothetical protein